MADPVLHIKDSYYFEVPKVLYPYDNRSRIQFPDVWVSLDPEYQEWEAERLLESLAVANADLPPKDQVLEDWHHWTHADHANFAKPLKAFLSEKYDAYVAGFTKWKAAEVAAAQQKKDGSDQAKQKLDLTDYLKHLEATHAPDADYFEFLRWRFQNAELFHNAAKEARDVAAWKSDETQPEWSQAKIAAYNGHLSGKILIPQPFATLRNLYEAEAGFAISKYLLIEVFVGLVLIVLFSRLAAKMQNGGPPRGKSWNLLETFLVFIRDQIVRPSVGGHHHEEEHAGHGEAHAGHAHADAAHANTAHANTAHAVGVAHAAESHVAKPHLAETPSAAVHAPHASAHHASAHHPDPSNKFLPLFWTIFFFVLGCNLMGMVPWAGAPTAAFAVTFALAAVTFATVIVMGMAQFGVVGFFLNQIPGMDLPWYMAIVLKPMILAIELLGLMIKHLVLAIRLLANMVAGHLVLLGVMGLAFGAQAALNFTQPGTPGWMWGITATIAVVGSAAFSILELFVAFLQAYIFTFLSALFVGAAIHKH